MKQYIKIVSLILILSILLIQVVSPTSILASPGPTDDMEDLDTDYTEVEGAGGGFLVVTDPRAYFWYVSRNESTYLYKDFGAAYFDGDFTHIFSTSLDIDDTFSWCAVWMLGNYVKDCQDYLDDDDSALLVAQYEDEIRLYEFDGAAVNTDAANIYTVPSYYEDRPLYCTVVRDESVGTYGTLYLYIYSDASRTTLLNTQTITLGTSKKDFRYLFPFNSRNSGDPGYTSTGWTGELYIDGNSPSAGLFDRTNMAFIANPDFTDDMEDFTTGWTINAKGSSSKSDTWAYDGTYSAYLQPEGDSSGGGGGYTSISGDYAQGCLAWIVANVTSLPSGDMFHCVAVKDSGIAGAYVASVRESGGYNYWRLRYYSGGSWHETSQTTFTMDLNTNYMVKLTVADDVYPVANKILFLWIMHDSDNDGSFINEDLWACVESLDVGDISAYDWDRLYIGYVGGASGDYGSTGYIDNVNYHSGLLWGGGIARGGTNDETLLYGVKIGNKHGVDYDERIDFSKSTSDGAQETWTYIDSVDEWANLGLYHAWPIWDSVNNRFFICVTARASGEDAVKTLYYTSDGSTLTHQGNSSISAWIHPSRIQDAVGSEDYAIAGVDYIDYTDRHDPATNYSCYGTLELEDDFTLNVAPIYRSDDIPGYKQSETHTWERSSDNNKLAIVRLDITPGSSAVAEIIYFICLDTATDETEGLNMETGTADTDTLNHLEHSGANFGDVQVGWTVRNLTDDDIGWVAEVVSSTKLHIHDYNGNNYDLFPDGDENYEVVCWSKWYHPVPEDIEYKGVSAHLSAYKFLNELWFQGRDTNSNPDCAFVGIASDTDLDFRVQQTWSITSSTEDDLDAGNGDIDAKTLGEGNVLLDFATNVGTAWFWQMDTGMDFEISITDPPPNIYALLITAEGSIVSTYQNCDEYGFVVGTVSVPSNPGNAAPGDTDYNMSHVSSGAGSYGVGSYQLDISNLEPNTEYFIRFYALADEYAYTEEISVTTTSGWFREFIWLGTF